MSAPTTGLRGSQIFGYIAHNTPHTLPWKQIALINDNFINSEYNMYFYHSPIWNCKGFVQNGEAGLECLYAGIIP